MRAQRIRRHSYRRPTIERFWLQVSKTETCWLWTGPFTTRGRPRFWTAPKQGVYAHRYIYEQLIGPIPDGLYVCHHCDNPACVRPDHLFVGTQDDNMKDMVAKDRANKPKGESNGRAKLTEDDVRYIRQNYKFRSPTYGRKALAERFGVDVVTIRAILIRKLWSHVE